MIIGCTSCNKKFEINSNLIPDSGRLLECSSCNNQWFFKKEKSNQETTVVEGKKKIFNTDSIVKDQVTIKKDASKNEQLEKPILKKDRANLKDASLGDQVFNINKAAIKKSKNKVKNNILNIIIVFIISTIGIIILVDTFKSPISIIIPNIELILFNLYETIKDIILFFKDLL
jgi:predicted Zn finger-like uncharacterized protein